MFLFVSAAASLAQIHW